MDGSGRVPPSIELAWGLRERGRRGPKPGLTLERIVAAGLEVGDREGLDGLSMGRLARDLGCAPMALYRYVASKDELLVLLADAAVSAPPDDLTAGLEWRAGLERWSMALLEAYRLRPWAQRIPILGPPITPNNVAWMEQGLRALRGTALGAEEQLSVIVVLSGMARSDATLRDDLSRAARTSALTMGVDGADYVGILQRLVDPDRFPAVSAFLAMASFEDDGYDDQADFRFGLARILDGLESLLRARADLSAGVHPGDGGGG